MQKKLLRNVILILLPLLLIFSQFIINFIALNNIYYHIVYEIDIPNSNEIIDKVETFEYHHYLKIHDYFGGTYNISQFNPCPSHYINRDCIEYIKDLINQDRKKFHWVQSYQHNLNYKFNATEQVKLYLSYSNTTIFNATYESKKEIFVVNELNGYFHGIWYLNFTYVPYMLNQSNTILLESIFLIKMFLDYSITRFAGEGHHIEQYIALSSNLQVIFIYVDEMHWS